jgi:DNA-binding CsgD family transcriptional regulator
MSVVDIAKQTGFSHETVRQFLRRYSIPIRQGRQTAHHITRRELVDLRQRGYTQAQIAERLGCSRSTVTERCTDTDCPDVDLQRRQHGGRYVVSRPGRHPAFR